MTTQRFLPDGFVFGEMEDALCRRTDLKKSIRTRTRLWGL